MIVLDHVSMQYPTGKKALDDITFHINKGEFVFIVGSSGSGKTTLIKLLLKEIKPTEGDIQLDGQLYSKLKRKEVPLLRRKIGVVFQDFRLLKDRTVFENVAFAQQVIERPMKEIRREVPAMLTMVGLADQYKQYPKQLSGGEQQRVAVARAVVNQPEVILADEPTAALDFQTGQDVLRVIEEVVRTGNTTVLMVTHNVEIAKMADRVVKVRNGRIASIKKNMHPLHAEELVW